jgi:hypothetical protein
MNKGDAMVKMIALAMVCIILHTGVYANESHYTSIKESECTTIEATDMGSVQRCQQFQTIDVQAVEQDLRQSLTLVRDGKRYPLEFWKTVSSAPSVLGAVVEWRSPSGKPYRLIGMITRLNVSEDIEDLSATTSYLVVSKVTDEEICVVGKIPPTVEQNRQARLLVDSAVALPCVEPQNADTLAGEWVETVSKDTALYQGFRLYANGMATSINMAKLRYRSWSAEGDRLTLSAQSINNGKTFTHTSIYRFSLCRDDTLCLEELNSGQTFQYKRLK